MTSNLPAKFSADWVSNEVVMPADTNSWESAINTLNDAIRIYASTGNFYIIDSFDTSSSTDLLKLKPVSYQSSNNETLSEYRDGMEINFLCTISGSAKYIDVNINNLGTKQIKKLDNQARITGSDLTQGFYFSLIYNSTQNCFYLNSSLDLSNINNAGTSRGAGWAFPSDTYENLTLGASGTPYTAPANGYVFFSKIAGYGGAGINLSSSDTGLTSELIAYAATDSLAVTLQVQKGETFSVNYSATGALVSLKFIYAQGSESEAS